MTPLNGDASASAAEFHDLIDHTAASADRCSDRSSCYAQPWKRTKAEDEAWPQNHVQDVCQPEHPHRDRRIPGASENCIDEVEHQDDNIAAQHDAGIGGAILPHDIGSTDCMKQLRREVRSNDR